MKKTKFLSVIAVGALLFGTGLTSCAQEPNCPECPEQQEPETEYVDVHHYGVSITTTTGGTVTTSTETAKEGEDVTLTVTPETNFSLTSLKVNGEEKATEVKDNKLTVKVGKAAVKVVATFSDVVYKVNISETTNGTVTSSLAEGITGQSVSITVEPEIGFKVDTFTVNGVDKKAELREGVFETTINGADITVAATFKTIDGETLFSELISKLKAAKEVELSGKASTINYSRTTKSAFSTSKNTKDHFKYTSDTEGTYAVILDKRFNVNDTVETLTSSSRRKVINENDKIVALDDTFGTTGETAGAITSRKVSTSDNLTSLNKDLINLPNAGKGYIESVIKNLGESASIDAKKLEITIKDGTYSVVYNLISGFNYKEFKGSFTFDGTSLSHLKLESAQYSSSQYSEDEEGNIIINEGVKPTIMTEEVSYSYKELGTESQEGATPVISELVANSFTTKVTYIDDLGNEHEVKLSQGDYYQIYKLKVGVSYDIKFEAVGENKILDFPNAELPSWGTEGVSLENNSYSSSYTIESSEAHENISIPFTSLYGSENLMIEFYREPLTSLTLTGESLNWGEEFTGEIETGSSIGLSVEANDISCDNNVAFLIEGEAKEGCKVTNQDGAYVLTAGEKAGKITVKAISTVDSSVISEPLEITIKAATSLEDLIPGTYVADTSLPYLKPFAEEIMFAAIDQTTKKGTYSINSATPQTGTYTFGMDPDTGWFTIKLDKAVKLTFTIEGEDKGVELEVSSFTCYEQGGLFVIEGAASSKDYPYIPFKLAKK